MSQIMYSELWNALTIPALRQDGNRRFQFLSWFDLLQAIPRKPDWLNNYCHCRGVG